jgi:hypothetical protein
MRPASFREGRAQTAGDRPQQLASRGQQTCGGSGGDRGVAAFSGDKAAVGREERFGGVWPRCHWWAGPGEGVRSVCGDANRAQI